MIKKICSHCDCENPYVDGACIFCGHELSQRYMHWIAGIVTLLAIVGLWILARSLM